MSDVLIQSSLDRSNQILFLNDQEVNGVQNVSISYGNNISAIKSLGQSTVNHASRNLQPGTVNVSATILTSDQFVSFTGSDPVYGAVYKYQDFNNGFVFTDAYLTSYNSRYNFGELPQIDASFVCLGDVGAIPRAEMTVTQLGDNIFDRSTNQLLIPGPGCLYINLDEFSSNRLLGYNINFAVNRTPVYVVGQRTPIAVYPALPINVTCSFQFEVNDYVAYRQSNYPNTPTVRNATLTLLDHKTRAQILSYNLSSLILDSETYEMGQNENAVITAIYKGFLV